MLDNNVINNVPYWNTIDETLELIFTDIVNHFTSLLHNLVKLELSIKSNAVLLSVLEHVQKKELNAINHHVARFCSFNQYTSSHLKDALLDAVLKVSTIVNNVDVNNTSTYDKMSPIAFGYLSVFCYHPTVSFSSREWGKLGAGKGCSNGVWIVRGFMECVKDVGGSIGEMVDGGGGLRREVMGDGEYYDITGRDEFYHDLGGEDEERRKEAERIAECYAESDGRVVREVMGLVGVVRDCLKGGVVRVKEMGKRVEDGDEEWRGKAGERIRTGERLAGEVRDCATNVVLQCYPQMLEVEEDGGLTVEMEKLERKLGEWWKWGGMGKAGGIWKEGKTKWEEAMGEARRVQEEFA